MRDAAAAGEALPWEQVIEGLVEPVASSRIEPRPAAHAVYLELMKAHAACEAHALGRGPDPCAAAGRASPRELPSAT